MKPRPKAEDEKHHDASYMTGQVLHPNGGTIVNG